MSVFMRASRLLSTLMLLQSRGRLTAQDIADRLEVSIRTVYRDVETLQDAGVPIYADTGRSGGYQLGAGYSTRLTGLTTDEADALFLTGMPGPAAQLGLGSAMAAAQLKLHAALPPELRNRAGRMLERFHLDTGVWYRGTELPAHLTAIANAVWNEQQIQVTYRRWKAPSSVSRTLEPYGLVLKAGTWYLVARSGDDFRTYRVDQVTRLDVSHAQFRRRDEFDLARYWDSFLAEFAERLHVDTATIRLSNAGRKRIRTLLDDAAVAAVELAPAPDDGGWTNVVVPIESFAQAETDFLKFGADLEVVAPRELRARFAAHARSLADLYADATP